ncbi:MAG: SCP2 sterol-binding domain-containing protein [Promethearchaeota archaeon]
MVDENLVKEIKAMRDSGEAKPEDALKMMELFKQIAEENEDVKEELEDIDTFITQFVITDSNYKYWVKLGDGKVDYAEGESDDASVTMSASGEIWAGLASGDLDSTSAYMSGDLQIEGNLQDAIAYGEALAMAMEEFGELSED